jgi:hypothetical protein
MNFEEDYQAFLQFHAKRRTGEKLRRLKDGHGHAEKLFLKQVWWPAVGHFRDLHPEYEVTDFQDGARFIDFAYVRGPIRICIEIDGFGPHARDIDRRRFSDNLMRQNQLVLDGWRVLRFAYDDLERMQRRCQQMIQQMLGRWFGNTERPLSLTYRELDIARLAAITPHPLQPKAVAGHLGIRTDHARKWLRRLMIKGILRPAGGNRRIRSYVLDTAGKKLFE